MLQSPRWPALLLAAALLTACETKPAPGPTLADAAAKYSARQIDDAEAIASQYIAANPSGANLDEAYYLRGLCRFTRGSRPLAALDLQQALARTTRPDLKAKAHRALGDIEFETEQWSAAQADYDAALAAGTLDAPTVTLIKYRMAVALQSLGQWQKAQQWFSQAIAGNPDPVTRERAVARMDATHFSLQFGAFRDAPNARDLLTQLQAAGITATIDSQLREGQLLYLVRSGNYATWTQAAAARDPFIAKYPLVTIIP
jgi:tetratricopeptide (TPR) repeat protein